MRQDDTPGNGNEFDALVKEQMAGLLEAARHEIAYYENIGDFPPRYMTPEELVGEAVIHARERLGEKPAGMSPRAWLYSMLFQAADELARKRREIQSREALSTDQKLPSDPLVFDPVYDDDEEFYEWFQPDEALKWEDVIPSAAVAPEQLVALCEAEPRRLKPNERRAALLYFRLGFSLEEVCRVLGQPPAEVGAMLEGARAAISGGGSR